MMAKISRGVISRPPHAEVNRLVPEVAHAQMANPGFEQNLIAAQSKAMNICCAALAIRAPRHTVRERPGCMGGRRGSNGALPGRPIKVRGASIECHHAPPARSAASLSAAPMPTRMVSPPISATTA